jgi:flagellin-like protein
MNRKGISPVIATVLLIAVTMTIAGLMSVWATGFVNQKMDEVKNQTTISCSGSISVDAMVIGGKGYAIVTVDTSTAPLTSWTGYIFYDDPSKNENAGLTNASVTLTTGNVNTFNFTNSSSTPRRLKVTAGNCPVATRIVDIK